MILLDAFMDPRLRGNDGLYSMDDGTYSMDDDLYPMDDDLYPMDDDLYSMDDVSRFYFRHPIVQRHCDNFVGSNSEAIQA